MLFKLVFVSLFVFSFGFGKNYSWFGGPVHLESELTADLLKMTGQYAKDNVIAIKAAAYRDKIYVLTPRLKHGVIATVSEIVMGEDGVELRPYPDLQSHTLADCQAIQNAVDFYLDQFSCLWILDSGVIETLESPRCTCPPKVVAFSLLSHKTTHHIELVSVVEPTSLLQYIVADYGLVTKPHLYIADASRGAIIVYDVASEGSWTTFICSPSPGLQIALMKHATHSTLLIIRVPNSGIIEIDTASLQRKHSNIPLLVLGDHVAPLLLLGTDPTSHQVYLRYKDSTDVISWHSSQPFNDTALSTIYSPTSGLIPMSISKDPLWTSLVVLESNYANCLGTSVVPHHRITTISK